MKNIKYLITTLFIFVFSLSSYSSAGLYSEVELIIESGAKETVRNGVDGFCSFSTSPYVYRFIVKTSEGQSFYKALTHVQISRKGSKNSSVSTYKLIGINDSIEPGNMGTTYRVFEKTDSKTNLPRYFYHASHHYYSRDKHFFANSVNVANGKPKKIDQATFYAELDKDFQEHFVCGNEI